MFSSSLVGRVACRAVAWGGGLRLTIRMISNQAPNIERQRRRDIVGQNKVVGEGTVGRIGWTM